MFFGLFDTYESKYHELKKRLGSLLVRTGHLVSHPDTTVEDYDRMIRTTKDFQTTLEVLREMAKRRGL